MSLGFFFIEHKKLTTRMPRPQDMQDTPGALEFEGGKRIIRSIFDDEIENDFAERGQEAPSQAGPR